MKSFELWRQPKGTLLRDIQQDQELDEGKLSSFANSFVKKLSAGFKGMLKGMSKLRFGGSMRGKITVDFPGDLLEAKEGSNTRKLSGTQVELFSCYYLYKELDTMGYDVKLRMERRPLKNPESMLEEAKRIQTEIDKSKGNKGPKVKAQVKRDYKRREEFAIATAMRLKRTIINDVKDYPNAYTVNIDSAGYAGEGSTKADFEINYDVKKIDEGTVVKNLRSYAISHKYNQEQSMGTQINSVYGAIYSLSTGLSAKEAGKTTVREFTESAIRSKFGRKGLDMIDRLHSLQGRTKPREGNEEELEQLMGKFYRWLKQIVEANPTHLLKFIGIEEGVDHFMVAFSAAAKHMSSRRGKGSTAEKEYRVFSSIDSKKYQDLVEKMYNEEFRKKVKCVATVTDAKKGVLDIKLYYNNQVIYETGIRAELNNSGKSKQVVGGIKAADMDDSETVELGDVKAAEYTKDKYGVSTDPNAYRLKKKGSSTPKLSFRDFRRR